MKESENQEQNTGIFFVKLKNHIIGAYGQYEELKPYYLSNGWKFKVSDLIKSDGTNVGPGCFFSLKQADILLPLMEKDGWNITGLTGLVTAMKKLAEERWKTKEMEKEEQKNEEAEKWKSKLEFHYLKNDVFIIYGDESKIVEVLDKLSLPKRVKSLASLCKIVPGCTSCYEITYRNFFLFLDNLGDTWNVESVKEWALNKSWQIVNPEQAASKSLYTLDDINAFFEWCEKNQTKLYAGTIDKHYNELKGSWRFKHFINKLTKFFYRAKNIDANCREWYDLHKPKFEKDLESVNPKAPRAKIIYTPMGGQKKK